MGNLLSGRLPGSCGGKVLLPDGTVRDLDRPTSVAELMLEHLHQFVVDLRSLSAAGNPKVLPLPADHMLEPDKAYLMLPMARGKAAAGMSVDEARQVLAATARSMLKLHQAASSFLRALGVGSSTVGGAEKGGRLAAERKKLDDDSGDEQRGAKIGGPRWSLEAFEERPEFLMRQYSSKRWKPSLGTIEERSLERKVSHWLVLF